MNKILVIIGSAIVVLAMVIAGIAISRPVNVKVELPTIQAIQEQFGAVSSSVVLTSDFSIGGVRHWYRSSGLNQASTTVCSFKAPMATSTLIFASLELKTSTSTTIQFEIGKAATPTATTTGFGTYIIGSLEQATIVASTTPTSTSALTFLMNGSYGAGKHLNFKYGGAAGTTNVLVGSCKAEWIEN